MKCNVAVWDRVIRFILGVALLTYAVAGGPFWSWIGLYLIFSAAWGLCFFYAYFKLSTVSEKRRGKIKS
jgi:hypothetical protein